MTMHESKNKQKIELLKRILYTRGKRVTGLGVGNGCQQVNFQLQGKYLE